jgi:hypothetical protein
MMAATSTLEIVGSVTVALIAAGTSSVGAIVAYQTSQRKKQPALAEHSQWAEVISAQKSCMASWNDEINAITELDLYYRPFVVPRDFAINFLRENIDTWQATPIGYMGPALSLREGNKASKLYRRALMTRYKVDGIINREEANLNSISGGSNGFSRFVRRIFHGILSYNRWILKRDIGSYLRRARKLIIRAQEHLVELSYLQPFVLFSPAANTDATISETDET